MAWPKIIIVTPSYNYASWALKMQIFNDGSGGELAAKKYLLRLAAVASEARA
jgi:hypothetical protein